MITNSKVQKLKLCEYVECKHIRNKIDSDRKKMLPILKLKSENQDKCKTISYRITDTKIKN